MTNKLEKGTFLVSHDNEIKCLILNADDSEVTYYCYYNKSINIFTTSAYHSALVDSNVFIVLK